MKKKTKIISALCCLMLFAFLALGSGEKSSTEKVKTNKNSDSSEKSADDNDSNDNTDDDFNYEITDTYFDYFTDSIGEIEYMSYVEITNTGSGNIYLEDATFDIEDDNEHLLQSNDYVYTCPDIIAPGEAGYFYYFSYIEDGVDTSNGLNLVPQITVTEASGEITDYEVSDTSMRQNDWDYMTITGRITNNTDEDLEYEPVYVIYYRSDGSIANIDFTYCDDIPAGQTESFEINSFFTGSNVSLDDITDYKVFARADYYQW